MRSSTYKSQVEERISKWPNLTDRASIEGFIARNRAAGARYADLRSIDIGLFWD